MLKYLLMLGLCVCAVPTWADTRLTECTAMAERMYMEDAAGLIGPDALPETELILHRKLVRDTIRDRFPKLSRREHLNCDVIAESKVVAEKSVELLQEGWSLKDGVWVQGAPSGCVVLAERFYRDEMDGLMGPAALAYNHQLQAQIIGQYPWLNHETQLKCMAAGLSEAVYSNALRLWSTQERPE